MRQTDEWTVRTAGRRTFAQIVKEPGYRIETSVLVGQSITGSSQYPVKRRRVHSRSVAGLTTVVTRWDAVN